MGKTALLLGATGETGKELLRELVHAPAFDKVRKVCVHAPAFDKVRKVWVHAPAFEKVSKYRSMHRHLIR